MVDLVKLFLSQFDHQANLATVSRTMCTHVRNPQNLWDAGAYPWLRAWLTPRNTPSPRAIFHCSMSNCKGIGRGPQNFLDIKIPPISMGHGWPIEICPSLHLSMPKLVGLDQVKRAYIWRPDWKKMVPLCSTYQGHSRSLEPRMIGRLRTTSH